MKKGMRERVSGDDVCDCCFGEQLDNKHLLDLFIYSNIIKFVTRVTRQVPLVEQALYPSGAHEFTFGFMDTTSGAGTVPFRSP